MNKLLLYHYNRDSALDNEENLLGHCNVISFILHNEHAGMIFMSYQQYVGECNIFNIQPIQESLFNEFLNIKI